ncbi:hypothetical protein CEQ90_03440 [Lewinellaceae bacterium SD302]|nr:hypothetical protein CEQ90_03440 [Lewinellaceae bacterium SD302]
MADWMSRYAIFATQSAGLHPEMSIQDFNYTIKISPKHNYAYAVTPKAGCTTLQKILIDAEFGEHQHFDQVQYMHYKEFLPFLSPMQIGDPKVFFRRPDIFTFCFVRNPYTRLLSGYLDKIVRKKDQRDPILEIMGKGQDYEISFSEFLEVVCGQPINEQDHHWRVQYYLTYQAGIKYDFIGRFENLDNDICHVCENLGITEFMGKDLYKCDENDDSVAFGRHHATGADALLDEYYTPELKKMVANKFTLDFEYFGYSI